MKVIYGSLDVFPESVKEFVKEWHDLTEPDNVHVCDGSEAEIKMLTDKLLLSNTIVPLSKYEGCYLARTNPMDVARVVSKTFMCTSDKKESMTIGKPGCKEVLGLWFDKTAMKAQLKEKFTKCMKGRTMYVLPYCMGPLGSPIAKVGIELTDSPYVVSSMEIMTIAGQTVIPYFKDFFVKSVHSVGLPLPLPNNAKEIDRTWPCNPEKTVITQFPDSNEIISFGSGYGGNSLLGKKCFALRLASNLARKEGWMAEHMLIMGLTSPENKKIYIAAAFPSACGKTNMAMMTPTLPGWKVSCVGDDIAWMRFDKDGRLMAINPENGFFGVCPGTNTKTNPIAMQIVKKGTIFTNVCETNDGGFFWEGLEEETDMKNLKFKDWKNQNWDASKGTLSSHANSRFCAPIKNCPILDEKWDDPEGVPISAIIFGGRRPAGVPLVYQGTSWNHGVLMGSCVKSETTAAALDDKAKTIVHDPFAMRPFFGYNCGKYMQHWIDIGKVSGRQLPLIFHVNWFLKDENDKFMWPGFGENSRVLKWVYERVNGIKNYIETPIGYVPSKDSFDTSGLSNPNIDNLFQIDKKFWKEDLKESREYFENVIFEDFPKELSNELKRIESSFA